MSITSYQYRLNGGTWTTMGDVRTFDITTGTERQLYTAEIRSVDGVNFSDPVGPESVTTSFVPNNVALASAGASIVASSSGAGFPASSVIDGLKHTNNAWGSGGGWSSSGTASSGSPEYVDITFAASYTILEVDIFTLADAVNYTTNPLITDTFTLYGVVDYKVQSWNGSAWVDQVNIAGNNKVWRQHTGLNFTTNKIRVRVTNGNNQARLVEVQAWGG